MSLFGDIIDGVTKVVGAVTGTILGLSAAVVGEALSIPVKFVQEAMDSGCTTYDEVRDWCRSNREW